MTRRRRRGPGQDGRRSWPQILSGLALTPICCCPPSVASTLLDRSSLHHVFALARSFTVHCFVPVFGLFRLLQRDSSATFYHSTAHPCCMTSAPPASPTPVAFFFIRHHPQRCSRACYNHPSQRPCSAAGEHRQNHNSTRCVPSGCAMRPAPSPFSATAHANHTLSSRLLRTLRAHQPPSLPPKPS
jgi:hypothetical protein